MRRCAHAWRASRAARATARRIDLEMTGLVRAPAAPKCRLERAALTRACRPSLQEVDTCAIIEIACIVTDGNLVRARCAALALRRR